MGVLGDTGMSAYFGMTDIAKPAGDDCVLISGGGGAVGTIAGQIAKLAGARVVGIVGSQKKPTGFARRLVTMPPSFVLATPPHSGHCRRLPCRVDVFLTMSAAKPSRRRFPI
ncbi:MAG: hypothetical protein CM15mP74_25470 [Halieaceae bacterium]|nr:MAG: hypothetical protein CM15mP74_25470 [Halieaceae bacterium]